MSTDYFIYNGIDTRDFNAQVFRPNVETVGPQLYTTHEIPGRNGDILLPKGKYPNRRERYSILCTGTNAVQNMDNLKNALLYQTGYQRLTDSFDAAIYYQAALTDAFDIQYTKERDAAKCQIAFNRMPQKFYVSGDNSITINMARDVSSKTIYLTNPTTRPSKPLIKLWLLPSTMDINGFVITVIGDGGFAYVDCENQTILNSQGQDISEQVSFSENRFPELIGGENTITIQRNDDSYVYNAYITPRWWKL